MRTSRVLLTLMLAASLLAYACGGDDTSSSPPTVTLSTPDGDVSVQAGIASYCWEEECVDRMGIITNADAPHLAPGDEWGIEFGVANPHALMSAWVVVDQAVSVSTSEGLIWEDLDYGLEGVEPGWATIPDPAMYVYVLQASWEGRGEVTYGFYLDRTSE